MEGGNKRLREDSGEPSPEAKRLHADLLLDILDADDDRDPAVQDLASVMRSFEEEIEISLPPAADGSVPVDLLLDPEDLRQSDLGYLLEASDDELGLPPTVPSSSDEAEFAGDVSGEVAGKEPPELGQFWGFNDEIPAGYDDLSYEVRPFDGDVFDGIFNYGDGFEDEADFTDLAWRTESMPAV